MDDFSSYDYDQVNMVWTDGDSSVFIGAEDVITPHFIKDNSIKIVITLNQNPIIIPEVVAKTNARHFILPFPDADPQEMTEQDSINAAEAVARLITAIETKQNYLIHCAAGINRSPSVTYTALEILGKYSTAYEAHYYIKSTRYIVGYREDFSEWIKGSYRKYYPRGP